MPRLPNPDEFNRVAPTPSRGVSSYNPTVASDADARLGQQIKQIADNETKRLDDLKAEDAETELMRKELELGEAYKSVRGGDVLKPEFHEGFKQRYNDAVTGIESTLSTPAQKARFKELAKRRSVGFDANRISYAMSEAEQFEKAQHSARIDVLTETATAQYANPNVVASTALQLEDEIVKWGVRQGMNDPAIAAAYSKEVKGNFYGSVIQKAIIDNDMSTANSMYAAAKPFLSNQQSAAIANQLKVGNDYQEGQKLAVEAQRMVTEGKSMAEVELFVATASTPGAYSAAQTIFTNLQQANAKAQAEQYGSVLEMFHTNGSDSLARQRVLNSIEFKMLPDEQRTKARDYMEADVQQDKAQRRADIQFQWSSENQAEAREDRAERRIDRERARKYRSDSSMALFYKTISDPNLKKKSRTEIYAMASEIGIDNVNKILSEHNFQTTAGNKPITIDKALLDAATPAEFKKTEKEAQADAYQGFVQEAILGWREANPGRQPTAEEQKAILRAANAEYTMPGRAFGTNSFTAYDEIPSYRTDEATAKRDILRAAASKGQTLTPTQVENIYRRSLQPSK